jgi:hypothetical protein
MSESTSAIANIQKLIKQLQKDALQQTLKQHAEPLAKIHTIMREHSLTADMIAMTFKTRKPRVTKESKTAPQPTVTTAPSGPSVNKVAVAVK